MKSKITKIQKVLMKGIAVVATGMMLASPMAYATTSLDDGYLESSWWEQVLYGKIGSTAKEIEEYLNSGETTLYITNETQLRALAEYVNNGNTCKGKEIVLLNDIVLDSSVEWTPIGSTTENPFSGIFKGSGYTISGVRFYRGDKTYNELSNVGFFGIVSGGTVKNLTLADSYFGLQYKMPEDIKTGEDTYEYASLGAIAGRVEYNNGKPGYIINCKTEPTVEVDGLCEVGGIVGTVDRSTVKACTNNARVDALCNCGGIVGYVYGSRDVTCKNNASIDFSKDSVAKILDCTNNGEVFGKIHQTGGIVGTAIYTSIIQRCLNTGAIQISELQEIGYGAAVQNAGGIAGCISGGSDDNDNLLMAVIDGCMNKGSVSGYIDIGGIVGQLGGLVNNIGKDGLNLVKNCKNFNTNINVSSERVTGYIGGRVSNNSSEKSKNDASKDAVAIMYGNSYKLSTGGIVNADDNEIDEFYTDAYGTLSFRTMDNNTIKHYTMIAKDEYSNYAIKTDSKEVSTEKSITYKIGTTNSTTDFTTNLNLTDMESFDSFNNIKQNINNSSDIIEKTETINSTNNLQVTYTLSNEGGAEKDETIYLKTGNKIKVKVEFNKYLFKNAGTNNETIDAPDVQIIDKNGNAKTMTVVSGSTPGKIFNYEYEIKDGDNFEIDRIKIYKDGTIYISDIPNPTSNDDVKSITSISKTTSINNNYLVDTQKPRINTNVYVENELETEIYTAGKEVIIETTTDERVEIVDLPKVLVKFGDKVGKYNYSSDTGTVGYAKVKEAKINPDGTTTWIFTYQIQEGDEGKISIEYKAGRIKDLCENETDLTILEAYKPEIYADTTAPTVSINVKKVVENTKTEIANNITNADKLEYTFTWSEEVTGFTAEDVTVNNGNNVTFTPNATDKKVYTMTVDTTVELGNVGDIQVIVEKGACQDIVGHENVRTESVIRVDKQAPILIGLEAYVNNTDSSIKVDENVDTVKEYYKVGDTVTIIATFSENIASLEENITGLPKLALQFSESGNAKETVNPGTISGNKITYTYSITDEDNGTLSVKGFSGTVVDAAGNETIVTKRNLNGNSIIADTKAPTLVGITAIAPNFEYDELLQNGETKRYGVKSKTRTENTITIIAEYSENVYNLSSNTINQITDNTDPVLQIKFGTETTRTAKYYKTEGNKIYYTYDITSEDNGNLSIVSLSGTVSDIAGNTCTTSTSLPTLDEYENKQSAENIDDAIIDDNKFIDNNHIVADTEETKFTITATAVNYDDNKNVITGKDNYYRKGAVITITATINEYLYKNNNKVLTKFAENGSDAPRLDISFSTSGNGVGTCTNVEYTNNQTIFTYTYTIKENDNGTLSLNIAASQGYDIALNGNSSTNTQSISSIIADTVNPVTNWQSWVTSEEYGIEDLGKGTWKVTFSEILYVYDSSNYKVGNQLTNSNKTSAPILLVSSDNQTALETTVSNITTNGNKTVITYTYSPYTRNLGAFGMKFANVSDKAGNLFNYKDQKAPTLSNIKVTSPETGTYKAGQEITIVATFNEKVTGTAPTLQLQFSDSGDAKGSVSTGVIKENTITYTYTITATDAVGNGDNGVLSIKSFTGTGLKDLSDNLWAGVDSKSLTLTGNKITADTKAPTVTITSDVERTNKYVVTYTFTWNEKVTGFTIDGIEVTNGSKGTFKATDEDKNGYATKYTLEVDATNEGRQIVKVNSGVCEDIAGNLNTERVTYNNVVIDYTKPVIRAKVNGGNYVLDNTDPENKKSTLKETIVVDEELLSLQYVWSSSETIPEAGWVSEDISTILVNSDINLTKEVKETGTYYLYIKATDIAGNTLLTRTRAFVVTTSKISLIRDKTEITNQDVTVTVVYGEGLTENKKAGVSGLTQSADASKVIIKENGTVYAEATDKAGNKVCEVLEIENIDKIAPEGTITYVTNEDKSVTATISFNEENVTITNNNGESTYVFEENGEFTFEFEDRAGNTGSIVAVVDNIATRDTVAPTIVFNYTLTTTTIGNSIGATITTDEDAIISYSWDNKTWTTSKGYTRSVNAINSPTEEGTYILYAKAEDSSGNESNQTLEFTVINAIEEVKEPEIIFEDLPIVQVNGVKYVKISEGMTTENLTSKMNKQALLGKTPEYTKLTEDKKLRTGSEITVNGKIKYIVVVKGDINCDGKAGDFIEDIMALNRYRIKGTGLSTEQILAGDINNDRIIDFIDDIMQINRYRIGIISIL